jgi:hypothetical protein
MHESPLLKLPLSTIYARLSISAGVPFQLACCVSDSLSKMPCFARYTFHGITKLIVSQLYVLLCDFCHPLL